VSQGGHCVPPDIVGASHAETIVGQSRFAAGVARTGGTPCATPGATIALMSARTPGLAKTLIWAAMLPALHVACSGPSKASDGSSSSGGGHGASGGASGTGGGGAAGSGGGKQAECDGTFSTLETVFAADMNQIPGALSVTADDLELFYSVTGRVFVRKRTSTSQAFSDPVGLSEIDGLCAQTETPVNPSLDVSEDGLRLYVTCTDAEGPLWLATRPDRNSSFEPAAESLGTVGASISISSDELVAFSSTTNGGDAALLRSERAATGQPFSAPVRVAEITGSFRHPELSGDGLSLFGVVAKDPSQPLDITNWRLAVASRTSPSGSFSAPSFAGLPEPPDTQADYAPTVSGGCASLYFTRVAYTSGSYSSVVGRAGR
jgi:hypothetical protein